MSPQAPTFEIAVAILWSAGKVWIQKRTQTNHLDGYWEFPGGKIAPGETPRKAVCREIREEVDLELPPDRPQLLLIQEYAYPERNLRIHYFLCRLPTTPQLENGQWVSPADLERYPLPPANLAVLEEILSKVKTLESDTPGVPNSSPDRVS